MTPSRLVLSAALALVACAGSIDDCAPNDEKLTTADALTVPTGCGRLMAGQGLRPGQSFSSCDGRFQVVLQGDGNLVLYQGSSALISSRTAGKSAAFVVMQGDGNFVLYGTAGQPLWNTMTGGHPGAFLALQDDGNLVLYGAANRVLWASHTVVPPGSRPIRLKVPSGYSAAKSYPLIIELHGLGGNADQIEPYFKMMSLADANQVFVIAANGTLGTPPNGGQSNTFWNATDGCCNVFNSQVDDVAYLRSLITWAQAHYSIDPKRVHLIGISNGGFMAHRMACDASDLVASVISVAGAVWNDPSRCRPTSPVAVLQVHGTADSVVPFNGTAAFAPGPVPSAATTYESWASRNGCSGANTTSTLDFDPSIPGAETVTYSKSSVAGCRARTELWAISGGGHVPSISTAYAQFFVNWFLNTPKP